MVSLQSSKMLSLGGFYLRALLLLWCTVVSPKCGEVRCAFGGGFSDITILPPVLAQLQCTHTMPEMRSCDFCAESCRGL